MSLTSALALLGVLGMLVLLYEFVLHAVFFNRSVRYRGHPNLLHYWWDRLAHHKK